MKKISIMMIRFYRKWIRFMVGVDDLTEVSSLLMAKGGDT